MTISQWSTTAGSNASGVTGVNWAEGQSPGTVNDSARAMMADVAAWVGQASGAIPEYLTGVAGTNTITATGPAQLASYTAGQRWVFFPAATNNGATTMNITPSGGAALGARNIYWNGAACAGGELRIGVPALLLDDGTRLHIVANGNFTIAGALDLSGASSGQIIFPATQNASAGANTLDDYEEGTWTPSVGGTATYTGQSGRYTKIGRIVYYSGVMGVNVIGTGSVQLMSGLPFTSANITRHGGTVPIFVSATSVVSLVPVVRTNNTDIQFWGLTAAGTSPNVISVFGNSTSVEFSGWYEAA